MSIYTNMTRKIVALLKKGTPPWRKPWMTNNPMPINAASKRPYTGINVFSLWMAKEEGGYTSSLWGTEATWRRLGGSVLKGQRPTSVYLFRRFKASDKKKKDIFIPQVFDVYNLDQIWGCLTLKQKINRVITNESQINFLPAEEIAEDMNVRTIHRGEKASYSPSLDRIMMPPKTRFKSQIGYWNTRFHELSHATGHASRLNRKIENNFQWSPEYAMEELVAEISTTFICSMIGIPEAQSQMPQHASYIKSWLAILGEDEKAIFKAAGAAQKAAEFVITGGASAKRTKGKVELHLAVE